MTAECHQVETMAYAGDLPWHGLGTPVLGDLTPEQMLDKAGINWSVEIRRNQVLLNGALTKTKGGSLVRLTNGKNITEESILTMLPKIGGSDDDTVDETTGKKKPAWNPVQNIEAAEFFHEFVMAGDMDMETAGSLANGGIVWMLAKIKNSSFSLFNKKDQVNGYVLFSNPHTYGMSTTVSLTGIRVVCRNTHRLALSQKAKDQIVRVGHRKVFDAEAVKTTMGVLRHRFEEYGDQAAFLSKKKYKQDEVLSYFQELWPTEDDSTKKKKKELPKAITDCLALLTTQPGAEYDGGKTWWSALNAVTNYVDHLSGRSGDEGRMKAALYGKGRDLKDVALVRALELAK